MKKKSPHSILVFRGGQAPTLAPLLRAPMSECDYIKCTMFSEIIHHIIISKYTLECTQLNYFLKIFLEEHTLESSINKIKQRYTHSTINNARGMYYNTTPLAKKLHPLFGHRFLPLKNDHSFRHPISNDSVDHNAMSAFPQEKNSHYTTEYILIFLKST